MFDVPKCVLNWTCTEVDFLAPKWSCTEIECTEMDMYRKCHVPNWSSGYYIGSVTTITKADNQSYLREMRSHCDVIGLPTPT